jgi:hypothetical protein
MAHLRSRGRIPPVEMKTQLRSSQNKAMVYQALITWVVVASRDPVSASTRREKARSWPYSSLAYNQPAATGCRSESGSPANLYTRAKINAGENHKASCTCNSGNEPETAIGDQCMLTSVQFYGTSRDPASYA